MYFASFTKITSDEWLQQTIPVNLPLMVYNTENGASLQELPDKWQILGKRLVDIIVGNCEKRM